MPTVRRPQSTSAVLPLRRGMMLHKYRIERKIGEGRFATVYQAYDTIENVRVAVKLSTQHPAAHNLFLHEARMASILEHPNIVRLKTAELVGGQRLLVSELGERTLADALDRPRPIRFALHVFHQMLRGLAYAHARGIIHRDVKPENILLWRDGRVKLTDFGIGQVISQDALAGVTRMGFTQTLLSPGSSSQTGTQLYMAPELVAGYPATTRADIYSLGVVLYQMLVEDFSRPVTTDWWKSVPDPLLRADLELCFAGNPTDRFAGAGQLAKQLRSLPDRRIAWYA